MREGPAGTGAHSWDQDLTDSHADSLISQNRICPSLFTSKHSSRYKDTWGSAPKCIAQYIFKTEHTKVTGAQFKKQDMLNFLCDFHLN